MGAENDFRFGNKLIKNRVSEEKILKAQTINNTITQK